MVLRVITIFAVLFTAEAFDLNLIQKLISVNQNLTKCVPPYYTLKMFDASAKIPSGILIGNLLDLGNFDECLAIEKYINATEETILGKYCLVKSKLMPKKSKSSDTYEIFNKSEVIKLEERVMLQLDGIVGLGLGWCIPHECQLDQLVDAINNMLGLEITPLGGGGMCQTKEDLIVEYDVNDICIIIFFAIILLLIVLSTVYDLYIGYYEKKATHILFTAFSVKTNGKKLLHTSNNSNQLSCLHGIRFISMMWVMYAHKYQTYLMGPIINITDIFAWTDKPINQYISNGTVAVDTFFVLSGLLVSYLYCLAMEKGVKFNIFQYYIHRYLRLTPVLAVVVWFHTSLISHLGSGPFWSIHSRDKQNCEDYWWAALLYIQNYYNIDNMCVSQTWYLSVDMQLYILSPLLLIPLWKWPKKTLAVCTVLLLGSMAIPFTVTYIYKFGTALMESPRGDNGGEYMRDYYFPTHTRYGTWLIGFLLGYYLFLLNKKENKTNLSPIQVLVGWLLGLGLLVTILFTGYELKENTNVYENSFYNAFFRHGWSLGVSWVIFACTQGYGGPINKFLSWSVFQVLSRFTYTMYLSHYTIMYLMVNTSRTTVYFTDFQTMFLYWGDFMLNLAICFGLILAFESPMMTIEKVLFGNVKKKPESVVTKVEEGKTNEGFENK